MCKTAHPEIERKLTVTSTSWSRLSKPQNCAISCCSTGEMLLWRGSKLHQGRWVGGSRVWVGCLRHDCPGGCGAVPPHRAGPGPPGGMGCTARHSCVQCVAGWAGCTLDVRRSGADPLKRGNNSSRPSHQARLCRPLTGRWASAPARKWGAWHPSEPGPGSHGWAAARSLRGQQIGGLLSQNRQRRRRRQRRQGTKGERGAAAARDLDGTSAPPPCRPQCPAAAGRLPS